MCLVYWTLCGRSHRLNLMDVCRRLSIYMLQVWIDFVHGITTHNTSEQNESMGAINLGNNLYSIIMIMMKMFAAVSYHEACSYVSQSIPRIATHALISQDTTIVRPSISLNLKIPQSPETSILDRRCSVRETVTIDRQRFKLTLTEWKNTQHLVPGRLLLLWSRNYHSCRVRPSGLPPTTFVSGETRG